VDQVYIGLVGVLLLFIVLGIVYFRRSKLADDKNTKTRSEPKSNNNKK